MNSAINLDRLRGTVPKISNTKMYDFRAKPFGLVRKPEVFQRAQDQQENLEQPE